MTEPNPQIIDTSERDFNNLTPDKHLMGTTIRSHEIPGALKACPGNTPYRYRDERTMEDLKRNGGKLALAHLVETQHTERTNIRNDSGSSERCVVIHYRELNYGD